MKILFFAMMAALTLSLAVSRTYAVECSGINNSNKDKTVSAVGASSVSNGDLGIKSDDAKKDIKENKGQ